MSEKLHPLAVDWSKRVCLILGSMLVLIMLVPLFGWVSTNQQLIALSAESEPIRANAVIALIILAGVLIGIELGFRRLAWVALLPAMIGSITFLQDLTGRSFGIDEAIFTYFPITASAHAGRMSPAISVPIFLAGYVIVMLAFERLSQRQTLLLALIASAVVSIGAATLLGYVLELNLAFRWGYTHDTSPLAAFAVALLGISLLARAWRENAITESSAPMWLPLPVVVGSATLAIILYLGLQDQELVRLREATSRNAINLAREFEDRMETQANELGYLAREWLDDEKNATIRSIEAENFLRNNVGGRGGQSISYVGPFPRLEVQEVFPIAGNEHLAAYSHAEDPERAATAQRSLATSNTPQISGSLDIAPFGPGYAIYVPLREQDGNWQFLVGEYLYDRVVGDLITRDERLREDYLCRVEIADEPIFDNSFSAQSINSALNDRGGVSLVFPIFERRVRFTVVRTAEAFARDRRNLPELMGAAGMGITILLGLSVHLARTAYTSLRTAEQSNQRLKAENEERRRIEAMLKVSDERLRLALDSTQIGIFEWNLGTNQIYYSPGLWAILDYAPGDVADSPEAWNELIHPEDLPTYRAAVEAQLSGEETFIAPEYRLRTGKGEWRWIYARAKTVAQASSSAPLRVIGTLQDITDRKEAEAALRESQAESRKLSLVASRTDNLVIICNPDGRVDWVNDSFTRAMEYDLDEIHGRTPDTFLLGPDSRKRDVIRIQAAMARGRGLTDDIVNYSKSGRKYHLHLELQPVRNHAGEVDTFIAILADITTRVETESALRRAKSEADAASRAKSEFLASMSHEIRTPMNGVIGMTSLLMDTGLDSEQRDFVNTIRTSGEALLTIINDILDFSKIESGKMELEQLPFALPTCLEEALELFSMQAADKQLDLAYHIEDDVPAWIMGDVTRLRQILVNLVNNAIKFTPSGSITVSVAKRHRVAPLPEDNFYDLEFIVADTGIGIPANRISRLFRPFSQVDSSTTRKYGGTGLGLAICHRLTQLMGGGIHVESKEGVGTKFIFHIATSAAHAENVDPLPILPPSLREAPVLIVEDQPIGRKHLVQFVTYWGAKAQEATSVNEAAQLMQSGRTPGLVLLDEDIVRQPGGESLLQTVRDRKLPTLVLLSPGPEAWDIGPPTEHLNSIYKPLRSPTLVRRIHSLFQITEPTTTHRPANRTKLADELPLKVLLVEDNLVNQKVAARFLERLGYASDLANNGVEGLAAAEANAYDLILMDVQMPEMDGFTASREIRRRLSAELQPKIVALTANALQGDREQCLEAGMDDYITKPVKLHELGEVIKRQFLNTPGASVPLETS
jgi:PAS domain S-box-containing protein